MRATLIETNTSSLQELFTLVYVEADSFRISDGTCAENIRQIAMQGAAQYGSNFDMDAFSQKAEQRLCQGEDSPVFAFITQRPFTLIDMISEKNVVEGWSPSELREWVVA